MRVGGPIAVVINDSVEDASNAFSRPMEVFQRRRASHGAQTPDAAPIAWSGYLRDAGDV